MVGAQGGSQTTSTLAVLISGRVLTLRSTSGGRDWSDLGIERTQEDALPAMLRTHVWKAGGRAFCPFEPGAESDVYVFGAT